MMANRVFYWAVTTLSVLALLLVVVGALLVDANRDLQQQIATRQQKLATAQTFNSVYQSWGQALITIAQTKGDAQIKDLLVANNITIPAVTAKPVTAPKKK